MDNDQVGFITGLFNICELDTLIHYINKKKGKSHIITSVEAETVLYKIHCSFMVKTLIKVGREGNTIQQNKGHLRKTHSKSGQKEK